MANKDHSLDDKIIKAAREEFLSLGFEKASLRKMAEKAGVTIGAIYTRYKTKDELFSSICSPLIENISCAFSQIKKSYELALTSPETGFLKAMKEENEAILHLLFDDIELSTLLLFRARGSSLENFFDGIIGKKIEETSEFLKFTGMNHPDEEALSIIIASQFHMYPEIIKKGCSIEKAMIITEELMHYHIAGCMALFSVK